MKTNPIQEIQATETQYPGSEASLAFNEMKYLLQDWCLSNPSHSRQHEFRQQQWMQEETNKRGQRVQCIVKSGANQEDLLLLTILQLVVEM